MTTTEQVGRAMIRVARCGYPRPVLESEDINAVWINQTLAQDALSDHAGGAEQDDFHPLMNLSRSALIVAASVVGMPCGKPL